MTDIATQDFHHRFVPGNRHEAHPLLLLHGTGGDETDLLPLGQALSPGASLLSPRGQVLENGMPRFFRRFAEGRFDEDDLRQRADDLAAFIADARARYAIAKPVAVGYSNGANIAAAMLLKHPDVLAGAILFRAMMPFAQPPSVHLAGTPILIVSGVADPIIPAANAAMLAATLKQAGAIIDHRVLPVGHQLSQTDLTVAREWLTHL